MKALLIALDSKDDFPDLAIMKLSAFLKTNTDIEARLIKGIPGLEIYEDYYICYISCIFKQNRNLVDDILGKINGRMHTMVGGGGYDPNITLPDHIEHIMPDYGLYGVDYSMGFTSRGCINRCPFCEVPKREGRFKEHADFDEFIHPDHDRVVLLDNNFLASRKWEEKLTDLVTDRGLKVNINQGLDARLIDKRGAKVLAENPIYDRKFHERTYYTAWDLMKNEDKVLKGITNLIEAGVNPRNIRPYILVNFNTTLKEDKYRFDKLRELGTYPFIMPYNSTPHPMERWGQRPALFKSCTFEEYCEEYDIEVDIP